MDVFEAVESRISCRAFLDKPVDQKTVRALITQANRAASGGNLQPWVVYALTGTALADFKQHVAREIGDRDPRNFKGEYQIYPDVMWQPYKTRRHDHGVQLYGALGVGRDDWDGRLAQYRRNFEFFNAPVGLFLTIDRRFGPGQWADLGSYLHTFMFLARGYGLDTCPQQAWSRIPKIVEGFLKVPASHMLFCGIALGYGDHSHPANSFRSPRAALDEFCTFLGFDPV
jgi:nitroreductase